MEEVGGGPVGPFEDLEVIRQDAGMSTARFVKLIGVPERTWRRWQFKAKSARPPKGPWPRPAREAAREIVVRHALKKPEWGLSFPWEGLTELTFGLRYGEVIAIGGGVGGGKTLLAHELSAHLINVHKEKVGAFMLEETVGNTIKNIAGKSANIPFHRPDVEFDPELLKSEALKYDGHLFLYRNFGQNDWEDIKR